MSRSYEKISRYKNIGDFNAYIKEDFGIIFLR